MKQLIPTPDQVVTFKDFCIECNCDTEHHAFFQQYHVLTHRVLFSTHCAVCYKRDPNECHEYPTSFTVYQWNKFINYNDAIRDN